jgi:hypothetical protein
MAWLAWLRTSHRDKPEPQVWHEPNHYYDPPHPLILRRDLLIDKIELKPGEEKETIDTLAARYPCPQRN